MKLFIQIFFFFCVDYDNRMRNQSPERNDQNMERYPRHNRYRDDDTRMRDNRGKEQQYDLSPIRDPSKKSLMSFSLTLIA